MCDHRRALIVRKADPDRPGKLIASHRWCPSCDITLPLVETLAERFRRAN